MFISICIFISVFHCTLFSLERPRSVFSICCWEIKCNAMRHHRTLDLVVSSLKPPENSWKHPANNQGRLQSLPVRFWIRNQSKIAQNMAWLGSCLIPFACIIQLLCFELHKARQQECFWKELYSFVQRLIPRTLSFFSKIVALVNELSCYNVWIVKIRQQPRYELKCMYETLNFNPLFCIINVFSK